MAERTKLTRMVIRGTAIYPHLNAPDTKYDSDGHYKVKLRLSEDAAEKVIAQIEKEYPKAKALVPSKVAKRATRAEPWEQDEDGSYVFGEIKMKASGVTKEGRKWERAPFLFDAKKNPLPEGVKIGNGSELAVAVELFPYFMASTRQYGISLRLVAVQVINLVEYGQRSADDFGFDEEDGFESDGFDTDDFDAEDEYSDDADDDGDDEDDYSAEDF